MTGVVTATSPPIGSAGRPRDRPDPRSQPGRGLQGGRQQHGDDASDEDTVEGPGTPNGRHRRLHAAEDGHDQSINLKRMEKLFLSLA
jgi:hypothetical protein